MKADLTVQRFASQMIELMNKMRDSKWEQGWLGIKGSGMGSFPMSVEGREYKGCNLWFLMFTAIEEGYTSPVYGSFKQLKDKGVSIIKGQHAHPVLYWNFIIKDEAGEKITEKVFNTLSDEEQGKCTKIPYLVSYNVFNIDQTDMKDTQPELYKRLTASSAKYDGSKDTDGMYSCKELDDMIANQSWLCEVRVKECAGAFYRPSEDFIQCPLKAQFKKHEDAYVDGQMFYDTLIHEMAHSTGSEGRLNRLSKGGKFGDKKYCKEELVAELTGALIGSVLGFETKVRENNAAYLDSWIKTLELEPNFIVSVMSDVSKAAAMIMDTVGIKDTKVA